MMDHRTFGRFLAPLGFALTIGLGACTQGGFVDEGSEHVNSDGNLAKSLLISSGAIDDENPKAQPKFQPRAPLVVPPKRNLPAPVESEASLAKKNFPVNPEDQAQRERDRRGDDPANLSRPLTLTEQEKYRNLPTTSQTGTTQSEKDASRPLKPWELDGSAQREAVAQLENTGARRREKNLISPPEDYRTPSSKAPVNPAPETTSLKPSWWPF